MLNYTETCNNCGYEKDDEIACLCEARSYGWEDWELQFLIDNPNLEQRFYAWAYSNGQNDCDKTEKIVAVNWSQEGF